MTDVIPTSPNPQTADLDSPKLEFPNQDHRPLPPTRQRGVALLWWITCTIWAYFAFGELVVAAGYPEALGACGVAAGFAVAGRRVNSLFDDARAVAIGATITALSSAVLGIVVPAMLVTIVGQRYVALFGLLLAIVVALLALRRLRRRERAEHQVPSHNPPMAKILVWLLVVVFTAVALTLSAQK